MNDCTTGMFILSYLLDPMYYRDGALRLALPSRLHFSNKTASPLVSYLITSARLMLKNEQKREQRGDANEGDILVEQLIAYMYHEAPFDLPCTDQTLRPGWWKSVSKDSNAYVVARLGVKLFSVVPSEMCDERTASKLIAMSTAKRNNLGAENLVRSLRLFNNPNPYGIKDCEAEEDEEDESDIAAPPLVIRRADGSPEPVVVDATKKPVKNTKTKWVEEDAEWDAEAW
ncbi:hypothetical protein B0H14DRAFT_3463371 [Mycena olivaceomarginata]|nr:hypothetical protein B0H14DRAFT_3463371 [Mycena olivaceomarginata]